MNVNNVHYQKTGHIGHIIFESSIGAAENAELHEICATINGDEDVWVALLKAENDFFSNSIDVQSYYGDDVPADGPAAAVGKINRPVIAAINGDCCGEGLEIALACDLRIAVENAHFCLNQIHHGRIPSDGGTQRLTRLVGKGKAMEMVLTGNSISAVEALEYGMINQIVKPQDLGSAANTLANTLATKAPLAVRYCKEAVYKGLDVTLEQGLRLEADLYFLLHTTSDRTEGVQSFLQKRKPEYKGQ
jgi:enoyl-CoA hydratase